MFEEILYCFLETVKVTDLYDMTFLGVGGTEAQVATGLDNALHCHLWPEWVD